MVRRKVDYNDRRRENKGRWVGKGGCNERIGWDKMLVIGSLFSYRVYSFFRPVRQYRIDLTRRHEEEDPFPHVTVDDDCVGRFRESGRPSLD